MDLGREPVLLVMQSDWERALTLVQQASPTALVLALLTASEMAMELLVPSMDWVSVQWKASD